MTRPTARLARLAASALAAAAATVAVAGWSSAPAQAAPCAPGSGVTVVVDYHQLGGGVVQACDAGGDGKSAMSLFQDAGFDLAFVQRQPGFVCRIDGKPGTDTEACVNTPPADAYWGLFWADGTSATWRYSTSGAAALTLHDGQSVAFSWQASTSSTPPGVKPPTAAATPSPSSQPSSTPQPKPSRSPSSEPSSSSASAAPESGSEASGSPSAGRKRSRAPRDSASPSADVAAAEASASPSTAAAGAPSGDPPATGGGGGLPGWAMPGLLAALLATGGGTAYLRRRAGDHGP